MEKRNNFILLRDLEDPSNQASGVLWGMLSNYVYGTLPPIALKGELFEALPADEQPVGIEDKIALRGLKQKCLKVECRKEDLQVISEHDAQILLAVQSYSERIRMLNERQDLLRWGVSENEECQVLVWMEDLKKNVDAIVHYKGALPPYDGIMFGVEIVDPRFRNRGTTDGVFRCQRYFRCSPGAGLFVSLDKLTVAVEEPDVSVKEDNEQDDYACIEVETKPSGEDSGMESSEHSLMGADLLKERSDALILDESNTDDSETTGEFDGCDSEECKTDTLRNQGKKASEDEEGDFKQLYLKEKKLLYEAQYRLKESKLRIASLEKRLDEEMVIREKLAEKCNALQKHLSEEALHRDEAESLLEEERSKVRKMQKRFDREWAEFERRLIEERAATSDMERQLNDSVNRMEEERNTKATLQRELEALQERLSHQAEFEQQRQQQQQETVHSETHAVEAQPDLESRDWIISRDEVVSEGRSLGTGGWGVVKEGKFRGCRVAVKQIHELILSPHNRSLFMREMGIASRCRHPCLLQFIGATNDDGVPLFVTELMDISLRDLLEKQPLNKADVVTIALDVTRALNYLHLNRPPIIHRDVSSANVLLWRRDKQWRAKVADYGTANFMRQCRTINPGAVIYSAPEALSPEQSPKIDVYSFGLLLCEMCIRELPVPHQTLDQISLITDRGFRDLVMNCVRKDPGERPNIAEVISELEQMEQKS